MSSCCGTCNHRHAAVTAFPASPSQLDVCLITLTFETPLLADTKPYATLNTVLNNIIDSVESSSHPTTFTTWSPCLSDPNVAVVISTAYEVCSSASSPVFRDILGYLTQPPSIRHFYFDYSIVSLAASSPNHRIPIDVFQAKAPDPGVAAAIGKHFGWDPKRSSLSLHLSSYAQALSPPGDLIKDFWAWAELPHEDSLSPSTVGTSFGSSYESLPKPEPLRSYNSDEKNMSLSFPEEDEEERDTQATDDETLIMIFQWSSHEAADRFKHPLQTSYGQSGAKVSKDLWDRHVAHPLRQLQSLGAKIETHRLELRAVEPRYGSRGMEAGNTDRRVRSGSKRLSVIASGLSDKVSGLWR
jgi:hypothetical protein